MSDQLLAGKPSLPSGLARCAPEGSRIPRQIPPAPRGVVTDAEARVEEEMNTGKSSTPFLSFGDRVTIDAIDGNGQSIFGAIDQTIVRSDA